MKAAVHRFVRSVTGKVFLVLTLCILALLLLNWVFNTFVFLDFYEDQKKTQLTTAYHDICTAIDDRQDLTGMLSAYQTEYDLSIMIWTNYQLLYSSQPHNGPLQLLRPSEPVANGAYIIARSDGENGTAGNGMQLYGKTRTGIHILLKIPVTNMRERTAITNRFLLWSLLVALLLSGAILLWLSRVLARPVRRLSGMAQRMAGMDFSERYTGAGQDELAVLGDSLNAVSETMEQRLSELKTANARLQTDMEQTARQNEARNRFIRNVSHELKTPISLIQTYAEGLHENIAADPADREYYCTVIEDEAQKLSQIITKLTLLMQLESGKEELVIEHFDLTGLISRLLQRHAPLFAERGVALPTLPDTPCYAWGDALLIENVMTNYLTNALHHVADGGTIRIGCEAGASNTVHITVFNTGIPIPQEDLPHIFESFYKVDKARTRAYGGTGIGLSVVAAIMQAHHMPYAVRNLPDGVEFSIDLPV